MHGHIQCCFYIFYFGKLRCASNYIITSLKSSWTQCFIHISAVQFVLVQFKTKTNLTNDKLDFFSNLSAEICRVRTMTEVTYKSHVHGRERNETSSPAAGEGKAGIKTITTTNPIWWMDRHKAQLAKSISPWFPRETISSPPKRRFPIASNFECVAPRGLVKITVLCPYQIYTA